MQHCKPLAHTADCTCTGGGRNAIETPYGMYLPLFPTFYGDLPSEERIEREVERLVDRADAHFMAGRATQTQYDAWMKQLHIWAESQPRAKPCV